MGMAFTCTTRSFSLDTDTEASVRYCSYCQAENFRTKVKNGTMMDLSAAWSLPSSACHASETSKEINPLSHDKSFELFQSLKLGIQTCVYILCGLSAITIMWDDFGCAPLRRLMWARRIKVFYQRSEITHCSMTSLI